MLTRRTAICAILAAPMLTTRAFAQASAVYAEDGWAIRGADPVAYFRHGKVVAGSRMLVVRWRGATWCFETAAHREIFELNPHRYAPQYGGYCAMALAKGELAPSRPETWSIFDDRLYLNDTEAEHTAWSQNPGYNIEKADENWLLIMHS